MIGVAAPSKTPPVATSPRTRDYLSYSAVATYHGCPLRYYFRYVAGLPERTVSSSLVFGSAVHRAVEYHFNELLAGNEPPTLEALLGENDRHWRETDPATVRQRRESRRARRISETSARGVPNELARGAERPNHRCRGRAAGTVAGRLPGRIGAYRSAG